jgi:hypothetical protein
MSAVLGPADVRSLAVRSGQALEGTGQLVARESGAARRQLERPLRDAQAALAAVTAPVSRTGRASRPVARVVREMRALGGPGRVSRPW